MSTRSLRWIKAAALALSMLAICIWGAWEILPDPSPTHNLSINRGTTGAAVFDFTIKSPFRSELKDTAGWGARLLSIQIWELDPQGMKTKCMWDIKVSPNGDPEVGYLEYGRVPEGWIEQQKAIALEQRKVYLLRDRLFFCDRNGEFSVVPGSFRGSLIAEQVMNMRAKGEVE